MRLVIKFETLFAIFIFGTMIYGAFIPAYAENNALNEEKWLESDSAVIKKHPVKDNPIIHSQESNFVENETPESMLYLSDEEIVKLEQNKLMNKHFYNAANKKYFPKATTSMKIGYPRHLFRPQILLPLTQTPVSLTYFNFITMVDNVTNFEVNSSLGFRKLENNFIFGVYIFHDYKLTKHNNNVNQVTLGLEYLCDDREARMNIYIPFTTKFLIRTEHYVEATFNGPQTLIKNLGNSSYEVVRPGFDVEVGGDISNDGVLSTYIKPFFFYHWDFNNIYGLSVRASFRLNANISFDAECTYDNLRKFAGFGGIKLSWMFGGEQIPKLSRLELKMNQMPIRDIDAVVTVSKAIEEFDSQTINALVAVINENRQSHGSAVFSDMNTLNHASILIDDILILDGDTFQGVAKMSNRSLVGIELSSFNQLIMQDGGVIDNCLHDTSDQRHEILLLESRMDLQKQISIRRERLQSEENAVIREIADRLRQGIQINQNSTQALRTYLQRLLNL